MLGHAGAVVVFDLVVDGHIGSLGNPFGDSLGNSFGILSRWAKARLCVGSERRYVLAMKIERKQMRKALRQWH
jgi:hypothetical protein